MDFRYHIRARSVDHLIGSHIAGKLEPRGIDICHENPRAASRSRSLEREQSDHPGADHQRRFTSAQVRNAHGMQRHRNRLQHRRFGEAQLVR